MLRIKEMPFLGTTNLEISRGGMPPDPLRGRAPPALGFTFTITIPIWNPPIQKSWLRRCHVWFSCSPFLAFQIYIEAEEISYRNGNFNKAFLSSFIYFT